MAGSMSPGNYHPGPNRQARRARKAQDRQTAKLARRLVMTQKHPQQEQPRRKQETLREILNDKQMEILTDGLCLLHRICNGPNAEPLPRNYARIYADQAVGLFDAFAAAEKETD